LFHSTKFQLINFTKIGYTINNDACSDDSTCRRNAIADRTAMFVEYRIWEWGC